ncbi:hypothetical protein LXL04_033754 [Taraxacum kok-saghyz]
MCTPYEYEADASGRRSPSTESACDSNQDSLFLKALIVWPGRIKELRKQKLNRKQKPLQSTADLKPVQVVCSGEVPNEGVGKKGEREHRDEGHGAISGARPEIAMPEIASMAFISR